MTSLNLYLVDVLDIFNFFCSGRGKGSARRREGAGARFLLKIPGGGGGGVPQEGEGLRAREGVCGELGNLGRGQGGR